MIIVLAFLAAVTETAPESPVVARARELVEVVRQVRGLETSQPVDVGVYNREELSEFILREAEREIEREIFQDEEKALKAMGLLPPDCNLWETLLEMYTTEVAGFYHPRSKQLKLIRDGDEQLSPEEELYMVHELTHAAQDQNFDLQTLPSDFPDDDDINAALEAVAEGDATLTMLRWRMGDQAVRRARGMAALMRAERRPYPRILRDTLSFRYTDGLVFVAQVHEHTGGDPQELNRLYRDFPLSSEQILHPEKYLRQRDNPVYLRLPDHAQLLPGPAGSWRRMRADTTWGELVIRIWFREHLARTDRESARMAQGWDGDRFAAYERISDGAIGIVWLTTWDSEEIARRFAQHALAALAAQHGVERPEGAGQPAGFSTARGEVRLERRGADVLILAGIPPEAVDRLQQAAWEGITRAELVGLARTPPRFRCPEHESETSWRQRPCPECRRPMRPIPRDPPTQRGEL